MSLIFGRLTQDFVSFQVGRLQAEQGSADAAAALPALAAHFRHEAAMDASYLVYIGTTFLLVDLR